MQPATATICVPTIYIAIAKKLFHYCETNNSYSVYWIEVVLNLIVIQVVLDLRR